MRGPCLWYHRNRRSHGPQEQLKPTWGKKKKEQLVQHWTGGGIVNRKPVQLGSDSAQALQPPNDECITKWPCPLAVKKRTAAAAYRPAVSHAA
jgi:hypothetical protein